MTGKHGSQTTVTPERSQAEIRKTVMRYGAERFGVMEDRTSAHVMFEYNGLSIQITVDLPNRDDYKRTENGRSRNAASIQNSYDQAVRQRWRALLLAIKAKLESVEVGISTLEEEFMAFVIMPDGLPLGKHLIPQLQDMGKTGKMPKLLEIKSGIEVIR